LFKLNVSEFKKKCFIKLFLEKEINFVDSVVYMDNEQKNYFEKKRFYDWNMDFNENRIFHGNSDNQNEVNENKNIRLKPIFLVLNG